MNYDQPWYWFDVSGSLGVEFFLPEIVAPRDRWF